MEKKIKVMFLLPSLSAGGAERVLITLMNSISREKFEPVFISINDKGPLGSLINASIQKHNLDINRVTVALPKLYKLLKQENPDIVFSTMAHLNLTLLCLRPLFPKIKFIVREAITPSFILDKHQNISLFLKIAYKRLYCLADRVISPAKVIVEEFSSLLHMNTDNHIVLYNPVDMNKIREADKIQFDRGGNDNKEVLFVAAGRLHFQKGFDRLIAALKDFVSDVPWKLHILGEGEQRAELESLIKSMNLSDKVKLLGLKDKPWPEYAKADCFLLPSRWEGLPNVALEALACGTPVIAMNEAGGIQEIADAANGDVVVCSNMKDFIKEMGKISPQSKAKFSQSLLPNQFDQDFVTKRLEEILQEVYNQKK